jgi:pilus assembly protein Flp/PilA
MATLRKLIWNETGATAIEYGLIAALIAVAAIASMRGLGLKLLGMYSNIANALP